MNCHKLEKPRYPAPILPRHDPHTRPLLSLVLVSTTPSNQYLDISCTDELFLILCCILTITWHVLLYLAPFLLWDLFLLLCAAVDLYCQSCMVFHLLRLFHLHISSLSDHIHVQLVLADARCHISGSCPEEVGGGCNPSHLQLFCIN